MRASYDSIDNKQKMCEKVNKDITFIQFFHSTRLHSTELFKISFSLLTQQLLFCKKLVGREKMRAKLANLNYCAVPFLLNSAAQSNCAGNIVPHTNLNVHHLKLLNFHIITNLIRVINTEGISNIFANDFGSSLAQEPYSKIEN